MEEFLTTLEIWGMLELAAGTTLVGWIITVYCIYDKYDSKKEKIIHPIKSVINATFAHISVFAVVGISLQLVFNLPDLTKSPETIEKPGNISQEEIEKIAAAVLEDLPDYPTPISSNDLQTNMEKTLKETDSKAVNAINAAAREILQRIANNRDTLASRIRKAANNNRLTEGYVSTQMQLHYRGELPLGNIRLVLEDGFIFKVPGVSAEFHNRGPRGVHIKYL